jgi:hypothetical protein
MNLVRMLEIISDEIAVLLYYGIIILFAGDIP